ncbi:MAG TPA: ABC transporter ATP-binding protein [Flavobacteriales bacterium]|nr:ABC transporter ATP-binding protein [Flavobacteriales bacterium]HRJ39824.1 ABC transporter ATP-binding protein [Flavobacteriales bacterium]
MSEKAPKQKGSWKKARRFLKYVGPYRVAWYASFVFLLLSSALSMAFPLLMGRLFDAGTSTSGIDLSDMSSANSVAILLFIVFGVQSVFSYFRIYLGSIVTEGALNDLRRDAYKKLVSLPISFFNKNKVGELNSRISADITMLQDTFNTTLAEFVRQFIVIIIGISALAWISWKLSLIMIATIPVMAIVAVFFGRFIKRLSKEAQDKVAESNGIVEETLTAIASVKAYANEAFEVVRYKKAADEIKNLSMRGAVWRGAFVSFIIFAIFGSIVFVLWQGVLLTQNGEIAKGDLVSFVVMSVFLGASFGSIPELFARIQKSIGASERLMDLFDETSENISMEIEKKGMERLKGEVAFEHVSFHYDSRPDFPVLNNVSFTVPAGQQIAIVGPSGAGKSTIASMLLRFYDPVEGCIRFDGKDALQYNLSQLRDQMAIVPQEVILFGGTIRENIAYGKPGASDAEIEDAANKANALEFIQKFPSGLDTIVGDRGVQLSGGQRQRIAIARAVLKDPSILILDEATSSLDSESERLVQDALEKLMKGRTSFVIAHRLSTIKRADQIFVVEDGQIKERGKHDELVLVNEGLYNKLSKMQRLGVD